MTISVEGMFTTTLGLMPPWSVLNVALNPATRRIDFQLVCDAKYFPYPAYQASDQRIQYRIRRQWRHLDFFQYEAWLHADLPRVKCKACGKTTQDVHALDA